MQIQHMREIIDRYADLFHVDDRKALCKYRDEFDIVSRYLEIEERRCIECHKILSQIKDRFLASTPAWVRDGIQDAMAALK